MILDCPSCSAKFKVDPALLGESGRSVRCGNCGHSWHQTPPAAESEPRAETSAATDADPLSAAEAEPQAPVRPRRIDSLDKLDEQRGRGQRRAAESAKKRSLSGLVGWVLLVVFVLGVAGGLVVAREQIMAFAPGTAVYYESVGLGTKGGTGLDLRDVTSIRRTIDGERRLIVKGVIVNTSDRTLAVPKLRASLVDPDGAELGNWIFAADSSELPPGGVTTFETVAADPPREGNLNLVFVE